MSVVVSSAVCYPVCYRDLHYFGAKHRRRIGARGLERGINARYGAFLTLITRLSVSLVVLPCISFGFRDL